MATFGRVCFVTAITLVGLYLLILSYQLCKAIFRAIYFSCTHPIKATRQTGTFCTNAFEKLITFIIRSVCSTYQFVWRLGSGRIEQSTWVDCSIIAFAMCVSVYKSASGQENWNHPPNISSVSSFYGPGAYLAWYITALTVTARHLWSKSSSPVVTPPSRWKPSGDVLAAVAYPVTALVDSTIQLCRLRSKSDGDYAEFLAASFPLHAASTLALSTAVMGGNASSRERYFVMIWFYWVMCQPTSISYLCGGGGVSATNFLEQYPLSTILGSVCTCLLTMAFKDVWIDSHPSTLPLILISQVILQCILMLNQPPFSIFPATGSVLADLDQAAALTTALVILLYSHTEQIISACRLWSEQIMASCIRFWRLVLQHWHRAPNFLYSILKKIRRRPGTPSAGVSV